MSNVFVFRQLPPGVINEYFGGGGKGGTSTSTVSIPPELTARYNSVNARAEEVAKQPFKPYTGEFVAPLTETQKAGIQGTNDAAGQAQPYFKAATGLTLSGAKDVGPLTPDQIAYYQNPYTKAVVDPTIQALQQQQGQQLSQQQTAAIKGGAFGGDRAGLQRAQLQGQQNLAFGQAIAPLYAQGYDKAAALATNQQGVVASDLARRMDVGQKIAGIGTAAQNAGLEGAKAQLGAGQIEQQTKQAKDTAEYQQFLQERGYDFATAQWLANIALGIGSASGSTTTTTSPGGFFSDKRLKNDVKEIGETHDGQPIYSYKYNGDNRTQIGLMAQDVEKRHPDAVGLMGGYKTVDYKKATEDSERSHKDMGGGLMPDGFDPNSMGGAVTPNMSGAGFERGGYIAGGIVSDDDWGKIVAANKQALGVYGGVQPLGGGLPGATGIVPAPALHVSKLAVAQPPSQQRPAGLSSAMQTGKDIAGAYKMGKEGLIGSPKTTADPEGASGLIGGQGEWGGKNVFSKFKDLFAEGGLVPRHAYADGGSEDEYSQAEEDSIPYDPSDVMSGKDPLESALKSGSKRYEMLKPANTGSGGGSRGSSLGLGKMAGSALGSAFGPFGSMAGGFLGGLLPFAEGGVVPRQGYALQGGTDVPADYSPEADMPSPNAQEAGLVTEKPRDTGALFAGIEDKYGLPSGYLNRAWQIESSAGQNMKSPSSSARGHFQFIEGTQKQMGLKDPYDLAESADAAGRYAAQNKKFLQLQGVEDPSAGHLYLAHQQGPLGAVRLLNAKDRSAGEAVGNPLAISGNRGDPNASGLTFANQIMNKFSGIKEPVSGPIPEGAPRPPGVMGGTDTRTAPSGAEGKKSIGDVVTSEGFVVPALGFLGSMLASNKPNFGQALGEGIMGGVGAYQEQRKQVPATAKVVEETRKIAQETDLALVDRLLKFNQVRLARGQTPITSLEEFKKKLADGSIVEAPGQPGAAQTTTGQPKPAEQSGAQPVAGAPLSTSTDATERTLASPPVQQAMSQINWNNVAPSHNIPMIQAEIETTRKLAETATDPATLQQLQEKQSVLRGEVQKILDSKTLIDKNGSPFVPPEWQKAANQIESQKTKAVKDADAYAAMEQDLRHNQAAMPAVQQKFEKLGDIMTQFQSDPLKNFKSYVPAIAQAVGMDVDPNKIETRAQFEEFVKNSRDLLFQQLKQVGGRILVTEVQRMQESVVDPHLQPAANRSLVASGKGANEYSQDFYDNYRSWKRNNPYATVDDFADMQRDWQNKHKLQDYITKAEANTPVKGDFPPPDKRKNGYQYVVDTPGVRNLVVNGKRVAPNGYIGRWDSKANDFVIEKVL